MEMLPNAFTEAAIHRTCFFLGGQKFQFSIFFTSITKSLVIGILALLSIFNGKDNKMVF